MRVRSLLRLFPAILLGEPLADGASAADGPRGAVTRGALECFGTVRI